MIAKVTTLSRISVGIAPRIRMVRNRNMAASPG